MIRTTIALALLLGASTAALAQSDDATATNPVAADRVGAIEDRMDDLESKLDLILQAVQGSSSAPADGDEQVVTDGGAADEATTLTETGGAADATIAADPTLLPQLEPGFVARTYPLQKDRLTKQDQVLAAFTITEPEFDYEAHLPHSMFGKGTEVAYELTGFLDVEEEGEHALGVMLAAEPTYSTCGAFGSVEGETVFSVPKLRPLGGKEFMPIVGSAKLQPGLYELRVWIACSRGRNSFPTLKLIHRKPSDSAPKLLDLSSVGHRVS